jgi:general secretion pathway protein M
MNLRERFDQLEERERKLLVIFLGVFSTLVLILLPLFLAMSVGSQEDDNERVREIIQQIEDERTTLGRRQADGDRVERRYAREAPALAGFLAQTADQIGVEIPETQDRSTVPHGKTFKERVTKIRLRSVGMLKLANFMDRIEHSGYAVSISKLNIKKRGTKADEFDAEMEISAFDREGEKKPAKKAKPAKKEKAETAASHDEEDPEEEDE